MQTRSIVKLCALVAPFVLAAKNFPEIHDETRLVQVKSFAQPGSEHAMKKQDGALDQSALRQGRGFREAAKAASVSEGKQTDTNLLETETETETENAAGSYQNPWWYPYVQAPPADHISAKCVNGGLGGTYPCKCGTAVCYQNTICSEAGNSCALARCYPITQTIGAGATQQKINTNVVQAPCQCGESASDPTCTEGEVCDLLYVGNGHGAQPTCRKRCIVPMAPNVAGPYNNLPNVEDCLCGYGVFPESVANPGVGFGNCLSGQTCTIAQDTGYGSCADR